MLRSIDLLVVLILPLPHISRHFGIEEEIAAKKREQQPQASVLFFAYLHFVFRPRGYTVLLWEEGGMELRPRIFGGEHRCVAVWVGGLPCLIFLFSTERAKREESDWHFQRKHLLFQDIWDHLSSQSKSAMPRPSLRKCSRCLETNYKLLDREWRKRRAPAKAGQMWIW